MTLTCAGCQRPNRSHRGYCGGCGITLQPVCRGCRFVNEGHDKFCGGCGSTLGDAVRVADAPATTAMPAAAAAAAPVEASTDEMSDLFAPVAVTVDEALPSAGITQSDLDRLFGVVS